MSKKTTTILVCDDQPMLRSLLASAIQGSWPNAEVVQAENGEMGEALIRKQEFDVIFMDVEMPKQNGFQTVKNLRDHNIAAGTPIVMCTGCSGETALVEGWKLNVDYYLTKPFDVDEIDQVLDEIKWKGRSVA